MPGSVREMLHEATAAIRHNADLLRKTLDHVGLGIAVFDADGKLEVWNDRFAVADRRSPREHARRGRRPRRGSAPSAGPRRLTAGTPQPVRELRLPTGAVTELRVDPLTGGGIVVTANDVTERVRAAEALRDSERRIRIVTDNVPVLIAYVDRDQRYRFTNRAYQAACAPAPAETEGRRVADVLGPSALWRLKPHIDAVLAGQPQMLRDRVPDQRRADRGGAAAPTSRISTSAARCWASSCSMSTSPSGAGPRRPAQR